jgi:ABC-2 type transport system permease protein
MPYLGLGFLNVLSVLLAARLVFGVPLRGSLGLLLAESLLFLVVSLALGVLIAAATSSQRTAMVGSLMGLMIPTLMLSGMIFPISSMPQWLQPVSNIVPGKWFLSIARGIMLKGVGLEVLWQETTVLAAMAIALLVAAMRTFNIRLG